MILDGVKIKSLNTLLNKKMPITSEKARMAGLLGGRPKGSKSKLTILKEKKRGDFDKKIALMAEKLTNAQAIVAMGTHKMVRMYIGTDQKMHTETIRDEKRMQNLLDTGVYGVDYVIVVGNDPDWKAANALLDRTFGKAKETIDVNGEMKFSLKELSFSRELLKEKVIDVTDDELPELSSGDELDEGSAHV